MTIQLFPHLKFSTYPGLLAKDGEELINKEYDFVDPAGGPFIQVDSYKIDGKPVKCIYEQNDNIIIEV